MTALPFLSLFWYTDVFPVVPVLLSSVYMCEKRSFIIFVLKCRSREKQYDDDLLFMYFLSLHTITPLLHLYMHVLC